MHATSPLAICTALWICTHLTLDSQFQILNSSSITWMFKMSIFTYTHTEKYFYNPFSTIMNKSQSQIFYATKIRSFSFFCDWHANLKFHLFSLVFQMSFILFWLSLIAFNYAINFPFVSQFILCPNWPVR